MFKLNDIQNRFIIPFSTLVVVALLIFTIYSSKSFQKIFYNYVSYEQIGNVEIIANNINQTLTSLSSILTNLADDKDFLDAPFSSQLISVKRIRKTAPVFAAIFLVDKNNNVKIRDGMESEGTPTFADSPCFSQTFTDNNLCFSDTYTTTTRTNIVYIFVKVKTSGLYKDGFIIAAINLNDKLFYSMLPIPQYSKNAIAYVVDKNGWVIIHPSQEKRTQKENLLNYSVVKSVTQGAHGVSEYKYEKEKVIGAYAPISLTKWGVIYQSPRHTVTSSIRKFYLVFLLISLLAIAGVVLLSVIQTQGIIKFLIQFKNRLLSIVETKSSSGYYQSIPVTSIGEMRDIEIAFNEMVTTLNMSKDNNETIINKTLNETKYNQYVIESIGGIFIVLDADLKITYLSKGIEPYGLRFGNNPKGNAFTTMFPAWNQVKLMEVITTALEEKVAVQLENFQLKISGKIYILNLKIYPVKVQYDIIDGIIITGYDITDERQVEDTATQKKEEQCAIILDTVPDAIFVIDINSRIKWGNTALGKICLVDSPQLIGKNFSEFLMHASKNLFSANMKKIFAGENISPFEVEIGEPKGIIKTFELGIRILEKNNSSEAIIIARFVPPKRALEKEAFDLKIQFEKRSKFFASLIETLPNGFLAIGEKSEILFSNTTAEKLLGCHKKALLGKLLEEFVKDKRIVDAHDILKLTKERGVYSVETYIYKSNGEYFPAAISFAAIKELKEEGIFAGCLIRDLINQKEREKRLRIEEKYKISEIITRGLSEKILPPMENLSSVFGQFIKGMDISGAKWRPLKEALEITKNIIISINNLILFLLPQKPELELLNPVDIAEETLRIMEEREILGQEIIVYRNFNEEIPQILIDSAKLKQALWNLLMNSVQAIEKYNFIKPRTPKGEIKISVNKIQKNDKSLVCFEIYDNGIGISEDKLTKTFTPFFGDNPYGSGLGLCIVKQTIEQLHGTLKIESKIEKGTIVYFTLPVQS